MVSTPTNNRRITERYPTRVAATVQRREGKDVIEAEVRNVSERGLFVAGVRGVGPGDELNVVVCGEPLAPRRIVILGWVRWADGSGAGIEIRAMLPGHRTRFERLLAHAASN